MNRTRRAFDYQPPSYEEAKKLSERGGSMFDQFIKPNGPRFFKPKGGDNFVRIMPPSWDNARHYALEVKMHRDIGPDKRGYLCLKENEYAPEKDCPICEERYEMTRKRAAQKEIDELRPTTSLLIYLIDRSNEAAGPLLWGMSNRSDSEILSQSLEKRQQVYLPIAHPIDGFDVEFTREGEGRNNTRYRGFKVARTSSPLTDNPDRLDEWLNYIEDNPIPEILQFFPASRIKAVFYGKAEPTEEERTTSIRDGRTEEVQRDRPEPARPEPEARPNGEGAPFEGGTPVRETLERTSDRPTPRETAAEPPAERPRRATLNETPASSPTVAMDALRSRLAQRRGE